MYIKKLLTILSFLPYFLNSAPADDSSSVHFLSFIIPCYNCAATVEESIASIYQQNLEIPFEVICTNDCSQDNTLAVLERCALYYPNLLVYTHKKNKGGGGARNTCVKNSHGDLIFCLDSDNVLVPGSIMPLVELLDSTSCDVAIFDEERFFTGNFNKTHSWFFSEVASIIDLKAIISGPIRYRDPSYSGNYLYTRQSYNRVQGYPEDFGAMDTTGFGFALLATGSKIAVLPNTFYWHRLSVTSYYVREGAQNAINHLRLLQKFSEVFSEETISLYIDGKGSTEAAICEDAYDKGLFTPASENILESLFKGYAFCEEGNEVAAANEFAKAIQYGCKSPKILQYYEHLK